MLNLLNLNFNDEHYNRISLEMEFLNYTYGELLYKNMAVEYFNLLNLILIKTMEKNKKNLSYLLTIFIKTILKKKVKTK